MDRPQKTVLITGSEGYLASKLIDRIIRDERVRMIIGVDIKDKSRRTEEKYHYIKASVSDKNFVALLGHLDFDTVVHAAWTFNPAHNVKRQDQVDIEGTINILQIAKDRAVRQFMYLGSTTCYGQIKENPYMEPFLKEEQWYLNIEKRLDSAYRYSRNKARVDWIVQFWQKYNPDTKYFWARAAIVLGKNTKNIVTYVIESPFTFGKFMFRIKGCDPPMQFISEYDIIEILNRALFEEWTGVVNVAGSGHIFYSNIIELLGRKELRLPWWLLYGFVQILWTLRLIKFPPTLLYMIRYPWVADIGKLKEEFGYRPQYSSREVLLEIARDK